MQSAAYTQLANANADRVSEAMFTLIDRLQIYPPGERVAAAAVLSILMAERFEVDPVDAFHISTNIIKASDYYTRGQQFRAARDYLKNEV
jgi:hypothetical protein